MSRFGSFQSYLNPWNYAQAARTGVENSITGFATGGQVGSKVQGSPTNQMYNTANNAASAQWDDFTNRTPTSTGTLGVQTTSSPTPISNQGGRGGAPAVNPYARWGGQAAFNNMINNFGSMQGDYRTSAATKATDIGNEYDTKSRGFLREIEEGQGNINRGFANNALNLRTTMADIIRGIQQGVKSAGTAVANMGGMEGSVEGDIARGYSQIGNQQAGQARGAAGMAEEQLMRDQGALNQRRDDTMRDMDTWKTTELDRIRNDFGTNLNQLDREAMDKDVNWRADRSLVDSVLNEALSRVAQIDQAKSQRMSGVKQWTPEQIFQEAVRLQEMGQAGRAFEYRDPGMGVGQGAVTGGAPIDNLPIFVRNREDNLPMTREEDRR